MNALTLMAFLTGAGTVFSFVSGVRAMARGGEIGHRSSAEWMAWRVVFQGAAAITVLVSLLARL